jgi:hypothetical protein
MQRPRNGRGTPCSSPWLVQAPPGVAAQPVHGSRTYRSHYEDADNDPYGAGQYARIIADFTVPPFLRPQQEPSLRKSSLPASMPRPNSPERRMPSSCCEDQHTTLREAIGAPKITLFHRLAQYTARQGLPVEWDDMAFALRGMSRAHKLTSPVSFGGPKTTSTIRRTNSGLHAVGSRPSPCRQSRH